MRLPPRLLLTGLGLWLILGDAAEHGPAALRPLQAQAPADAPRKYAVLVGVEAYQHARLREPQPLRYPVEDVTELAAVLKDAGYEVVLLTDDAGREDETLTPTRANIDARIKSTLRKCGARDTALLAFAGHGVQFSGQADAYFCPLDARPFADETETLVSITGIYRELEKSFAGIKVILIDACRNDPTPGRGRGLDADAAPAPPKGVAALFSCSAGQRAYEHDDLKHGVFFFHVLQGMNGKAANVRGDVTFDELSEYVRDQVPESLAKLLPGYEQLPNMKADLVGRPPVLAKVEVPPPRPKPQPPAPKPKPAPPPTPPPAPLTAANEPIQNSIGMSLMLIPPGEFLMGSPDTEPNRNSDEGPQHKVRITKPFYLGQLEVAQWEWEHVMGRNPSGFNRAQRDIPSEQTPYLPVETVSWFDAIRFCNKLSELEGLAPYYKLTVEREQFRDDKVTVAISGGQGYRLPTEAEWEYACRNGTTTPYNTGTECEGIVNQSMPSAVGSSFESSLFRLHDVHGNVWEWCQDAYERDAYQGRTGVTDDPFVELRDQKQVVVRGGAWITAAANARSASRRGYPPERTFDSVGFRVARNP